MPHEPDPPCEAIRDVHLADRREGEAKGYTRGEHAIGGNTHAFLKQDSNCQGHDFSLVGLSLSLRGRLWLQRTHRSARLTLGQLLLNALGNAIERAR